MLPKTEPLPRYKDKFSALSDDEKEAIIRTQVYSKGFWWNPDCTTKCKGHNKVHKYSFEAYVEGWVTGYYGFDSIQEINNWLENVGG